jgi:hypothetical protein
MKIWPFKIIRRARYDELIAAEVSVQEASAAASQLDLAEARTQAVQLRLACVKAQRNEALAAIDNQALLAQARASTLENDLDAETQRANELADDLTQLRRDWATLCRVEDWLHQTVAFAADAAEAPVFVLVREGAVHSVHRSEQEAQDAARRADPSIPDGTWRRRPAGADPSVAWCVTGLTPPTLGRPPRYKELADHYGWEDGLAALPAPREEATSL